MKKKLTIFLLALNALIHSSAAGAWEFIDKDGDTLVFDLVSPSSDLKQEEELFVQSFYAAYTDYSLEMLGVKDKISFLHGAFEDVREDVQKGEGFLISAKKGEEVIGVLEFKNTEKPGQIYIAQLAVSPQYWQKGIGKELVFSVCKLVDGVEQMLAIGRRINNRGKGFFTHIGFTECKYIHPGYDPVKYIGYEFAVK
ncbi:MAG: GNAT family N-acetyltransferase [Verrucomicrobia bacterium]|nr:GNAT family N-acetyltransferase [Verrucomicrobiota bacterium]